MYIDLHSHMDICEGDVISEAKKAGLKIAVTAGINPESNRKALELAQNEIVKCSIGLYPIDTLRTEQGGNYEVDVDSELAFVEENLDEAIAIGEIGLDYKNGSNVEEQKELFRRQLDMAKKFNKPVIIHSRKAERDVLDILDQYDLKVILHMFSGKKKLVQRAIEKGYFMTIPTCVVSSEQFQALADKLPLNQLFCETDAPFLSPFKDKKNQPAYVIEAYRKVAEIKGMDVLEVANLVYNNYQRVFE